MTYLFSDFSVTTWGKYEGRTIWRANDARNEPVYFTASTFAHHVLIGAVGAVLLGKPITDNGADLLTDPNWVADAITTDC